jgi:glycogen synthase
MCAHTHAHPRAHTRARAQGIKGILNGVEDMIRPDNQELGLNQTYDADSLDNKVKLKMRMQQSLNLPVDSTIPMFVFLGRLDAQKGCDVMFESIDKALAGGARAQFITMGSGIEELEEVAADLEDKYPDNFRAILSFKGAEKYQSYAAADWALMPSRYEPCGLVQMEGMRFGTLPIVAPTGGLADTVADMQTGLVMEHEIDQDCLEARDVKMMTDNILRAVRVFTKGETFTRMQKEAMRTAASYSWSNSAKAYINTFAALSPQ